MYIKPLYVTTMERTILQQAIKDNNPWWYKDYTLPEVKERAIYSRIRNVFEAKQIIALTGLRRVGKTTLMKQAAIDFMKQGLERENIFYFSFDEFPDLRIREVLQSYEEIQEKKLGDEKILCLFDEIQKAKNWQEQLKRIYDDFQNLKFIISGSESLFIKDSGTESLAGRIYEFTVKLLDFQEYLDFKNIKHDKIELYKNNIRDQLKNYLKTGGFPEMVFKPVEEFPMYIKSIIDKVIDSDMPKVFDIKNTAEVRAVFNTIYNDPGQMIEIKDLGEELQINRNKTAYILNCLEKSFLIKKLYNYSTNSRKVERKLKKYYSSVINPYLIETSFGKVFENFIIINTNPEYFWRDTQKNEVDAVMTDENKKVQGIEIKSGTVKKTALQPLERFAEKFHINKRNTKIISFDQEEIMQGIEIIPFYKYLLKKR